MDKELAKKKIEDWVKRIPASEKNVPYFHIPRRDGVQVVSPEKAIKKLSKDQKTENFIASKVSDQLDPETEAQLIPEDTDELVKKQLQTRLDSMTDEFKKNFRVRTDGKEESIESFYLKMIKGTKEGKERLESYKKVYLDLMSKLGD